MVLILAEGHKVDRKQNLFGSFLLHSSQLTKMKLVLKDLTVYITILL